MSRIAETEVCEVERRKIDVTCPFEMPSSKIYAQDVMQ